jgi:uncharacterized membrane protein
MSPPQLAFSLQPVVPVPVVAVLAGGAALLTLWRAVRGRPLRHPGLQVPAVLLRLAAIALLTWILLNPSDQVTAPQRQSRSLVLLDASASMTLAGDSEPATRWQEATAWTRDYLDALRAAGQPEAEVRSFAADSMVLNYGDRQKWPEPAPSGQESKLAAALTAAVRGNPQGMDHVVVVSDGCIHDRDQLTSALTALRDAGATLSTKSLGRDVPARNAALVSVVPPRIVRAQTRVTVPVELEAAGVQGGESFTLRVTDESGAELTSQSFEFPAPASGAHTSAVSRKLVLQSPARTTRCTLTLSGPGTEATQDDNRFDFTLEVVTTKLRVLFAEGTHAKRALGTDGHFVNEMEMMTAAWDATGEIEWEAFTPLSQYVDGDNLYGVKFVNGEMLVEPSRRFPQTKQQVFNYDVIIVSDVPKGNFTDEQMQWVADLVTERGGGFLMAGGNTAFDTGSYDQSPWEKITPVDMREYGDGFFGMRLNVTIPRSVRNHPVWQIVEDETQNNELLDSHPWFDGMNRVRRAKPGAVVLAVEQNSGTEPVIAAQTYGRGRSIAYLPDPNGGWGEGVIRWSPDNAPQLGARMELGHGNALMVSASSAKAPQSTRAPYPSPYYARFWVNTIKWLGENSIRWRRDKLSGSILAAQASPGTALPVAVEYLAETDREKLAAQDIGARLDFPGSPRVRLHYDRDRREFTGSVIVPEQFREREAAVVFDTVSGRESLTDVVRCGVLAGSREFARSAPDAALMAELAQAGGGKVLTTPASAAEAGAAAAELKAVREQRTWYQPAWTHWPVWSALLTILGIEWLLRRAGRVSPSPATA